MLDSQYVSWVDVMRFVIESAASSAGLFTYFLTYLLSYILTYLLHGAESFLRS